MRRTVTTDAEIRLASAMDDLPPHLREQLQRLKDSGRYDRRYLAYLAERLRKSQPQGDIDEHLGSLAGEQSLSVDPYRYQKPGDVMHDWAQHHFARGGFDLTARPLEEAVRDSRSWGSTYSEIEDDLGDGWSAIRRRDPKVLQQYGEDLDNCVEKGHHTYEVTEGYGEIWIVKNERDVPVAMIRTRIEGDGRRLLMDVRGPSNHVPDEMTQNKIQTWLSMHPDYEFGGYTPEEEDHDFQMSKRYERQFIDDVQACFDRGDFAEVGYRLTYMTSKIVGMFADQFVDNIDQFTPENVEYLMANYPRRMADAMTTPEEIELGMQYPKVRKVLEARERDNRTASRRALLRLAQLLEEYELSDLADRMEGLAV